MFSETRYALNGDLRVAYRASREGPRDIVFVPNWFTNCEVFPELPSLQGWVEAMTSLGRLIFFDQPGTGASDPVTPGALPTLEQWADSITAVLDDLGSREAVLLAIDGAFATAALFAATHPSRTTALVVLEGYADPMAERTDGLDPEEVIAAVVAMWGTGEIQHVLNPDMPWNEEIRAAWADMNAWRRAQGRSLSCASRGRSGRAGGASDNPRAHPRRPAHRRPDHPAASGKTSLITYRREVPRASRKRPHRPIRLTSSSVLDCRLVNLRSCRIGIHRVLTLDRAKPADFLGRIGISPASGSSKLIPPIFGRGLVGHLVGQFGRLLGVLDRRLVNLRSCRIGIRRVLTLDRAKPADLVGRIGIFAGLGLVDS